MVGTATAAVRASVVYATLLLGACTRTGQVQPVQTPTPSPAPLPTLIAPTLTTRGQPALQQFVDSLTEQAAFRSAQWGVLIVDPESGDTIASRNADKLFMPASNMKLVTGAVSLAVLGAEYRWTTAVRLLPRGGQRGRTFDGDLLLDANFDPTMSDAVRGNIAALLGSVADSLRARGIDSVTGNIQVTDDPALTRYGYGWALDDILEPYSAGTGTALLQEGEVQAVLTRCVDNARQVCGVTRPIPGLLSIRGTLRSDSTSRLELAIPDDALAPDRGVRVIASLKPRDSLVLTFAQRAPAVAYTDALRHLLRERGIGFGGRVHAPRAASAATETVASLPSPTVSTTLPAMLQPSQNQLAEMFYRTLGSRVAPLRAVDSAARAVVEQQLLAWGAESDGFAVRDGSGLSRHNYLSARTIVRVLDAMYRTPTFPMFRTALPTAGVNGTLRSRMRNTAAAGRTFAKTGTLDKARSLSGYVRTADDRWVLFSLMANNFTAPRQDIERVQDAIVVRLASTPLRALRTQQ
jgi:serine-type D-Ala-D-Ala carboxypeptidase/endopeptidase (penicillin-binding protein 4)